MSQTKTSKGAPSPEYGEARVRMSRRSQRIELAEPLRAYFGTNAVTLVELNEQGAAIEHQNSLAVNATERMRIEARDLIEVTAVIRHSVISARPDGSVYRSGVAFRGITESARVIIESILVDEAMRLVRMWEANADGVTTSPAIASIERRSAHHAPPVYVWMRLVGDVWHRATTRDPNQPLDGFALPATEEPTQIALLCRTYEATAEPGRNLVRALAQLVIAQRIFDLHSDRGGGR